MCLGNVLAMCVRATDARHVADLDSKMLGWRIIIWSHRLEHFLDRFGTTVCTRTVHAAENSVIACKSLIWLCGMYGGLLTMPAMLPHMLCTGSYQEPVLTCIS